MKKSLSQRAEYRVPPEIKQALIDLAEEDERSQTEEFIWLIRQEVARRNKTIATREKEEKR